MKIQIEKSPKECECGRSTILDMCVCNTFQKGYNPEIKNNE